MDIIGSPINEQTTNPIVPATPCDRELATFKATREWSDHYVQSNVLWKRVQRVFQNKVPRLSDSTIILLQLPSILAQLERSTLQLIWTCAQPSLDHIPDFKALTFGHILKCWVMEEIRVLGRQQPSEESFSVFVSVLTAWILPLATRSHNRSLTGAIFKLLDCVIPELSPRESGWQSTQVRVEQYRSYGLVLAGHALFSEPAEELEARAIRLTRLADALEALRLGGGNVGQDAPRLNQNLALEIPTENLFDAYIASPKRGPLGWPSPEDRLPSSSSKKDSPSDHWALGAARIDAKMLRAVEQSLTPLSSSYNSRPSPTSSTGGPMMNGSDALEHGRQAMLRMASGSDPDKIPPSMFPLCVHHALEACESEPWHNDDRYLLANYWLDVAPFDIEDLGVYFERKLGVTTSSPSESLVVPHDKRVRHVRSHLAAHQSAVDKRLALGRSPFLTPRCETLGDAKRAATRQTFICPFANTPQLSAERLTRLMTRSGVPRDRQFPLVERTMLRQHAPQTLCLEHFNALAETLGTATRQRPISSPVFFTLARARSTVHNQ
jgi:hypothetical protein